MIWYQIILSGAAHINVCWMQSLIWAVGQNHNFLEFFLPLILMIALSKHQYERWVDLTAQPLILMVPFQYSDAEIMCPPILNNNKYVPVIEKYIWIQFFKWPMNFSSYLDHFSFFYESMNQISIQFRGRYTFK